MRSKVTEHLVKFLVGIALLLICLTVFGFLIVHSPLILLIIALLVVSYIVGGVIVEEFLT